ncbi:unnamed protein product [Brassicogethes aeneus]|uniref:WH2 domain-containing protein n=1 Tax=Brassicogethes aeneus TaxID=1431903 RepID=A0A9P0B8E4_BRAAE|nr:unnamed protein product [Brassicogethes aeneus]
MLHITEDTPVDMLTGAMDLTVHLPNGRSVKMSVKRSTPMMDLLMQISTKYNLQLSDHTLQALSMAPSPDNIDRLLPFKPNTPIGLIDTQNIKVLPKPKMVKNKMAPQPFESTFRLKVHLPRNQLYVTRVSKFVLLEDILKKACLEKALDPKKYALHHPGNLDEVLDPKLTLNDYQITEVYLVAKGTVNLNQVFSASDLMVLRKEEERKRMQAKTGGGVLSLIFGKKQSGMGSGSLSSENRSISPSHSDDSRSVTPPAIPNQIIAPQIKEPEKPKPPQRKRRPAPKPPTVANVTSESRKNSDANPPSSVSDSVEIREGKSDNSLTICHSRNSSDSSGYHEASILSDNCNTSLPRRPQSAYVSNRVADSLSKMRHSMSHSRKKKAAPPPPPSLKSSASVTNLVAPSPVVASQNTGKFTHFFQRSLSCTFAQHNTKKPPKPGTNANNKSIYSSFIRGLDFFKSQSRKNSLVLGKKTLTLGQIYKENTILKDSVDTDDSGSVCSIKFVPKTDREIINHPEITQKCLDVAPVEADKKPKLFLKNGHKPVVELGKQFKPEAFSKNIAINNNSNLEKIPISNITIHSSTKFSENEDCCKQLKNTNNIDDEDEDVLDTTNDDVVYSDSDELGIEGPDFRPPVVEAYGLKRNNSKRKFGSSRKLPCRKESPTNTLHKIYNKSVFLKNASDENWNQFISKLDNIMETSQEAQVLVNPKPLPRKKFIQSAKDEELNKIEEEPSKTKNNDEITEDEIRKIEKEEQVVLRRKPKEDYRVVNYKSVVDALKDFNENNKRIFTIDDNDKKELQIEDDNESLQSNSLVEIKGYKNDNDYNQLIIQNEQPDEENRHFKLGKMDDKAKLKVSKSLPNIVSVNEDVKPPEIVGMIPKQRPKWNTKFDTFGRKTCYKIGMSLVDEDSSSMESGRASVSSAMAKFNYDDEIDDYNDNLFERSAARESEGSKMFSQLYGMHSHEVVEENDMKKWNNCEDLDNISQNSIFDARNILVNGDSLTSNNFQTPLDSLASHLTHSEDICTKTEEPEPDTSRTPPELPANPPPKILLQKKEVKKEVVEEAKSEPEEIKVEVLKPEVEVVSEDTVDKVNETEEPKEVDWQYQLPPPPEGFRDASSIADATINDATIPDSVVTSPELFEKLKAVEDTQSEPATVASSTISEDENPLLNNLSLENLEKRKSLVYNRELATSLKMTDGPETFTTSLNKFESTYEEIKRSSLTTTEPKQLVTVKRSTSTLPNFKITPYNNPKKNITVFEDDTIRSNTYIKNNVTAKKETNLSKSYVGRSMENISFRKNSWENQSDDDKSRDTNYNVYRPNQNMKFKNALANSLMYRSESFSSDNHGPIKPVSRSKSTLTLNKYKEDKKECTSLENRSNSLLDVSGLQSLEVMKSIQNRLNTSVENINKQETSQLKSVKPEEIQPEQPKVYHYRSPPSINLGTWSERPKAPISVKEDVDYNVSSKLIVNTTNNNITSNNSIEVNNKPNSTYSNNGSVNVRVGGYQPSEPKHVTIKVNGTEPISTEKSGNVVIKIGSCKPLENQKFVSYRKPLGNINKIQTQRPHSIAFDDLSHVPVVRSVELKKPYKDMTSITQINQVNEPKPVSRVNSFTPVVRGFKRPENMNTPRNRLSWNPPNPNIFDLNKPKDYESYSTNKDVPFSQSNLRRTDSKKILNSDAKTNLNNQKNSSYNSLIQKKPEVMQTPPPPPPSLPKFEVKKPRPRQIEPKEDPRDLLLDSIRNFGGKKGLKSIKG